MSPRTFTGDFGALREARFARIKAAIGERRLSPYDTAPQVEATEICSLECQDGCQIGCQEACKQGQK